MFICYSESHYDINDDYCEKARTPNDAWNYIYEQEGFTVLEEYKRF